MTAADRHADTVRAEISRTDTKASVLLAADGALLAGIWTIAITLHPPTAVLLLASLAPASVIASAALLLAAVRPRLGGNDQGSFPYWATRTPEQLVIELAEDRTAHAVAALSRIAVRKMTLVQRAVDLIRAAGAAVALSSALYLALAIGGWD